MVHTEGSEESMKKDGAFGMEINCVSNMIRRSIDQRIAAMPGEKLSRMDSWIIHYMLDHQQEDVFQKDVERALAMTRSNVSKAVDQMVHKGLILRSPVDWEIAKFEQLLAAGFTSQELTQFKEYLGRVARNINDSAERQKEEKKRRDF